MSMAATIAAALLDAESPKQFIRRTKPAAHDSQCGHNCVKCGKMCTRVHRPDDRNPDHHICQRCDYDSLVARL
jgi:hypothetical protein